MANMKNLFSSTVKITISQLIDGSIIHFPEPVTVSVRLIMFIYIYFKFAISYSLQLI